MLLMILPVTVGFGGIGMIFAGVADWHRSSHLLTTLWMFVGLLNLYNAFRWGKARLEGRLYPSDEKF